MATRIREDLIGVVYLGGCTYRAGDEVPDDVRIGGHLTEDGKDHDPAAASSSTSEPAAAEDDSDGKSEKSSTSRRTKSSGKSSSSRSSN